MPTAAWVSPPVHNSARASPVRPRCVKRGPRNRRGIDGGRELAYWLAVRALALGRDGMWFDLDTAVKVAQVAAYVAVPILVGVIGHLINRSIATQNIARDYVGLGLGILRERRSAENANLHDWAVKILQTYSPVPFSPDAQKELFESRLAPALGRLGQGGERRSDLVVTPDGTRVIAREGDGALRVWDLATGQEVARLKS